MKVVIDTNVVVSAIFLVSLLPSFLPITSFNIFLSSGPMGPPFHFHLVYRSVNGARIYPSSSMGSLYSSS